VRIMITVDIVDFVKEHGAVGRTHRPSVPTLKPHRTVVVYHLRILCSALNVNCDGWKRSKVVP
jgi:hypothetical protein